MPSKNTAAEPVQAERVRRFWHLLWVPEAQATAELMQMITPDICFRGSLGQTVTGPDGVRGYINLLQAGMPDFSSEIQDVFAEGDRIAVRIEFSGTHKGKLLGIPASGRFVTYPAIALMHMDGDRFDDVWVVGDTLNLLRQLEATQPN